MAKGPRSSHLPVSDDDDDVDDDAEMVVKGRVELVMVMAAATAAAVAMENAGDRVEDSDGRVEDAGSSGGDIMGGDIAWSACGKCRMYN